MPVPFSPYGAPPVELGPSLPAATFASPKKLRQPALARLLRSLTLLGFLLGILTGGFNGQQVSYAGNLLTNTESYPSGLGNRVVTNLYDLINRLHTETVTGTAPNRVKAANREQNKGVLKDDVTGETMVDSPKSKTGVKTPPNAAQVDHKFPIAKGGTRTQSNLELRTATNNRKKSDK